MKREEIDMLLDEEDELLLMQYFDGESGLLGRVRARALLARSQVARDYATQLESVATIHHEVAAASSSNSESRVRGGSAPLWPRIQQRIEQERRTAILLGRREIGAPSRGGEHEGVAPWHELVDRVLWGFGGAAVAAALLLVVAPRFSGTNSDLLSKGEGASLASAGVLSRGVPSEGPRIGIDGIRTASLLDNGADEGGGIYERPRMLASDAPDVVEVDWMRGGGRVRVIPDESERAPIIWVKRNNRALALRPSRRSPSRSLSGFEPQRMSIQRSGGLYDVEEGSLEQPLGGFFGQE